MPKKYVVQEIVCYEVEAESTQEAIDSVIEDCSECPCFVKEREVINGPEGWEDDDYDSP